VTLNQKQNGGSWVPLGSWSFAPGAGHKVALAAEGTTVADAVLFVAAGAQPANLLYVHADHLGSPQKLTDASQATVWDGVFNPFGEEVAITGLAAMPMRFLGQYADEETGFRYNYFRDYEPNLGRYIQSDPIGLQGGINTFVYVANHPLSRLDPLGLFSPAYHEDITRSAAYQECPQLANGLPHMVGDVDSHPHPDPEGAFTLEGDDPNYAYKHGMSNGITGQSPAEAEALTEGYIEKQLGTCTLQGLANALHAEQDKYPDGHRGYQPYSGGMVSLEHIWGDTAGASGGPLDDAYHATRDTLRRFKEMCPCECQ
jgi:RHS repeat-associated protein